MSLSGGRRTQSRSKCLKTLRACQDPLPTLPCIVLAFIQSAVAGARLNLGGFAESTGKVISWFWGIVEATDMSAETGIAADFL